MSAGVQRGGALVSLSQPYRAGGVPRLRARPAGGRPPGQPGASRLLGARGRDRGLRKQLSVVAHDAVRTCASFGARFDRVVPLGVEGVAFEVYAGKLAVADLDSLGVGAL